MTKHEIASYLDLANHRADSTEADIKLLCEQVLEYKFHSAFVNPCYVEFAKEIIGDKAAVGTVLDFPLGQGSAYYLSATAYGVVDEGANELDVSINVGLIKEKKYDQLATNMRIVVAGAKIAKESTLVKFIIETGYLTEDEIIKASEIAVQEGADFIKTCSGFGPRGATIEDVKIIRKAIGNAAKIKVAGGITTLKQVLEFIDAGADRIGTSHAVEIINEVV